MNSQEELLRRKASGLLGWRGPLFMTFARAIFLLAAQTLVSILFLMMHTPHPFQAAAKWWTVWATLADLACLVLLARLTRREGIALRDLLGLRKKPLSRDILFGIVLFIMLLPVVMGGIILGDILVYGTWWPSGAPVGIVARELPIWAVVYSRVIWWPVWSLTEQMTFNGYALPRLQVLANRSGPAVALVVFGWCLQHVFLPFFFDWRYLVLRIILFIPYNLIMAGLYLRLRRLPPLVVSQWGLDFISTLFTIA